MQYLEKNEIKEIQLGILDYVDEICKKIIFLISSAMELCWELFAIKE